MTVAELIENLKREPPDNVVELWQSHNEDDVVKSVASSGDEVSNVTWVCNFGDEQESIHDEVGA